MGAQELEKKGEERSKGLFRKVKDNIKRNIFFRALPYAILISSLTLIGLFGGFVLGKGLGGSIVGFIVSLSSSMLGFFAGLLISYTIIKIKYPVKM